MTAARLPLRRFVDCLDGQRVPLNREERSVIQGGIPYWGANGIVDYVDASLFDEELVLLGEDGAPFDDPLVNVAFRVDGPVWVNNHIHALRPKPVVEARYIAYALNATDWMPYVTGSTRLKLTQDDMMRVPVASWPLHQQLAIADFLDTETGRIDILVAKKRLMIGRVAERLSRQVDDALAPRGNQLPMPTLSAVTRIAEGQVDPRDSPYSGMPLIAPNHLEAGTGRLLQVETAAEQGAISGKYLCDVDDVIYSKIRPALRKVCIAPQPCLTSADMYPIRPLPRLLPGYLFYFLLSERFTDFAVMESERVAMPKINRDALGRIRISLPTIETQRETIYELDKQRTWANELTGRLESQISLLKEHRQALVTAAVTGVLEVPGVAA